MINNNCELLINAKLFFSVSGYNSFYHLMTHVLQWAGLAPAFIKSSNLYLNKYEDSYSVCFV